MGVTVRILFLSQLEVEICPRGYFTPIIYSNERLKNSINTTMVSVLFVAINVIFLIVIYAYNYCVELIVQDVSAMQY